VADNLIMPCIVVNILIYMTISFKFNYSSGECELLVSSTCNIVVTFKVSLHTLMQFENNRYMNPSSYT
jgi:hypothetical protein